MSNEPLPVKGFHHVELWVGNAKQAAYYYRRALGFDQLAYAGPETGVRDRASYLLGQGKIRLALTSPVAADHPISAHLARHGDGVRDVAFSVEDVERCYREAVARGAEAIAAPETLGDGQGSVRRATVRTYGDTVHSFVSGAAGGDGFLPGYAPLAVAADRPVGLLAIDHVVGNVEEGRMQPWREFYERVFGFEPFVSFDDKDISTEFSALRSQVMANASRSVKMPINEPAVGRKKSQIQEYLDFNAGAGVQHLALLTDDIIFTVSRLRENGVEFLAVPDTYYDEVWERVGAVAEERRRVRELGILVDRDERGYLLQLFTRPVQDRPTLFYEIIQRRGCQSFGKGNFKALFESIEREQARRGNL